MKTLFIDTHLFDLHIVLFNNNEIEREEHILEKKQNSIYLMPSIKKVLNNDIPDRIVVINGPGSFTGVRLGITIAKTLAYTLNIPIYPLTYFELMNNSSDSSEHTFAIDDSNGYFIAKYNNNILEGELRYFNYKEIDVNLLNQLETAVSIDFNKVLNKISASYPVNPHSVNPIYVKLIGVEYDKKN